MTARNRALADAERHRRHMERVSEVMAQHDVEEAEAAFKVMMVCVWAWHGRVGCVVLTHPSIPHVIIINYPWRTP